MKMLLALLSTISLTGGAAVASLSTLNGPINQKSDAGEQSFYFESIDKTSFDIEEGTGESFALTDLTTLIKKLQEIHVETGQEVAWYGIPAIWLMNENNQLIKGGWMKADAITNVFNLINGKNVEFGNAQLSISALTARIYTISLNVKVNDIDLSLKLFEIQDESLPIKQDGLQTIVHVGYELR